LNKNLRNTLLFIGIPLVMIVMIFGLVRNVQKEEKKQYHEIVAYFYTDKIDEFSLNLSNGKLDYVLKGEETIKVYKVPNVNVFLEDIHDIVTEKNLAAATNPDLNDEERKQQLIEYDYIEGGTGSWLLSMLPTLILIVLLVVFWIFMMRRMNAGMGNDKAMGFGKAKIKKADNSKKKTTFADVAGADEEKAELFEIVDFLKAPKKYNDMGARIPKGVLLVGPPGTGKTLLARAVAGEAGVPFFSISGSDFVEMFVGVGASRVRDLFDQAKKNAPSIMFIDEIDAVGRQRGTGLGGGHDEREQTLNQLLVEMDGFGANEGVIVMAATNRADVLDPALLRPGRFDRQIVVNYPDAKGREEILKVHSRGKPLGPDVNLRTIAQTSAGFTGADLENLLNEAALLAVRKGQKAITESDVEEATIKVVMGVEKKSRVIKDNDKMITSYHEAGHAIVSFFLPTQDKVHQISIIPRGMAAGYTMYRPDDDRGHVSKTFLKEELCSLLGGRVAEKLTQKDICTGASNDIERASQIARDMVRKYGMSERLGPVVYGNAHEEVFLGRDLGTSQNYSDEVAAIIDEEVKNIINEAFERSEKILTDNMEKLHKVAGYLFLNEKMSGEQFAEYMENGTVDGAAI